MFVKASLQVDGMSRRTRRERIQAPRIAPIHTPVLPHSRAPIQRPGARHPFINFNSSFGGRRAQRWAPAIGAAVIVRGAFPGRPEGQRDRMGTVVGRFPPACAALRLEGESCPELRCAAVQVPRQSVRGRVV